MTISRTLYDQKLIKLILHQNIIEADKKFVKVFREESIPSNVHLA